MVMLVAMAFSCNRTVENRKSSAIAVSGDTTYNDSIEYEKVLDQILLTVPKETKPVAGYRFAVQGDFNGDGLTETLTEHYTSGPGQPETNKFYDSLVNIDQLIALTARKQAFSFVSCSNGKIDTLQICSGRRHFGLSLLNNEGDLNGDGSDEISYVVNWADWSSLNTCYLMGYTGNRWEKLYSFSIWDWQLPDLPQTYSQYGLFGLEDKIINTTDTRANQQIEQQLNEFEGFIKLVKPGTIQIRYRNEESFEDTIVVDLQHRKTRIKEKQH
jgi:hypothetical protein